MELHKKLKTAGWRQGSLFSEIDSAALNDLGRGVLVDTNAVGIVITHSCDLLNDSLTKCPMFEILVGNIIAPPDGLYKKRRNPRMLHLPIMVGVSQQWLELRVERRLLIERDFLAGRRPDKVRRLQESDRRDMVHWLADSYQRSALPDGLQDLLRGSQNDLSKVYRRLKEQVSDILLSIYPDEDVLPGERYSITMTLVVAKDNDAADTAIHRVAQDLKKIIEGIGIDIDVQIISE